MKLAHFRKGTDVAGELSVAHEKERMTAKSAMLKIITSLKYLARQNIAIRGHFDNDSDFQQLLHLRAIDSDHYANGSTETHIVGRQKKCKMRYFKLCHIPFSDH